MAGFCIKHQACWCFIAQCLLIRLSLGSFTCDTEGGSVVCSNDSNNPVSVLLIPHRNCEGRVTLPSCFISSDCETPFFVAQGERKIVVSMADGGQMCGWFMNLQISYQNAVPDGQRYSPPFLGRAGVGQSYQDCVPSHCGDTGDAIDFGLDRGVGIVAAREGVVTFVEDNHGDGGSCVKADGTFDPSAFPEIIPNVIRIRHADNTETEYVHLQAGIKVKVGEVVSRGQLIGHNGNSGCSGGPHLHFQVLGRSSKAVPSNHQVPADVLNGAKWSPGFFAVHTVPVRFDFQCIKDFIPKKGMSLSGADATSADCSGASTSVCSACTIPSGSRPTDTISCHANTKGMDGSLREVCCENAWTHPVRCAFSLSGDVLQELTQEEAIITPGASIVFGILSAKKAFAWSFHGCTIVPQDTDTCTASNTIWTTALSTPTSTPVPTPAPTQAPTQAPTPVNVVDFESGSLTSGGLTFSKISGDVEGQPTTYTSAWDSSNPSGGGSHLFRTDFNGATKVFDGPQGVYRSTAFRLKAGDITFDYAGSGGFVALCLVTDETDCKKRLPSLESTTMKHGRFNASELEGWIGEAVFFELVDDQSGSWGHMSIDNIRFYGDVTIAQAPVPGKRRLLIV